MTALALNRNTVKMDGFPIPTFQSLPLAASAKIFAGSIVCTDGSGNAVPGSTSTSLKCVGRAKALVDNTDGDAGDLRVDVEFGVFKWANSGGGDAITNADRFKLCWVVDDQTVAKTDGGATRSIAGVIIDVADGGVFVLMVPELNSLATDALQPTALQQGSTALVLGTKTINTLTITGDSQVFLTRKAQGGTVTDTIEYEATTVTPGTPGSFVINAAEAAGTVNTDDTSTIAYLVVG